MPSESNLKSIPEFKQKGKRPILGGCKVLAHPDGVHLIL